ncbi:MAG: cell division protein ZapA [Arenicellales bacterium]|nr:cell division protein ZapA [Arenicellales bacterium]
MSKEGVKVRIMDREFTVACRKGEQEDLQAAADYLNHQLQTVQSQSKMIGLEHGMVVVALNVSNELLRLRRDGSQPQKVAERLRELTERVSAVTSRHESLAG